MMPAILDDPQARRLVAEAAAWRLTGLLLERPVPGWQEELAELAAEVDDAELREAVNAAAEEAGEGRYDTTFGPGGPASPREVTYRRATLTAGFLAELRAFYEAFAYQPRLDEPPDHVAVQAGFVGYLRLKEAFAQLRGDADQAALTRQAADLFVTEHLVNMAGPLGAALSGSGIRYLASAGAALVARTGMPRELPLLDDLPAPDDDTCGNPDL